MINIINCEQGSAEWLKARMGRITGSRIFAVLDRNRKGEEGAKRRDLKATIMAEMLTFEPEPEGFVSYEMRWGTDNEPMARASYEVKTGNMVDQVGFIAHPTNARFGVSPDGIINPTGTLDGITSIEGMLECKCPKTSTHLGYLLADAVPEAYEAQMQWEMGNTDAGWNDFVSYDPRLPEHLQLFVKRLMRDNALIAELESEASAFLDEVDALIGRLPQPPVFHYLNPDEKLQRSPEELEIIANFCKHDA